MTQCIDVAGMVAGGTHVLCPGCGGLLRTSTTDVRCRWCGAPLNMPHAARPARQAGQQGCVSVPEQGLVFTVYGTPVTQGSVRAVAPGVMLREKGTDLERWRNAITREAMRRCGGAWMAETGPVRLDAVFTVRRPPSVTRLYPTVPPDADKLLRAVQDALSPRLEKGESVKARRVAASQLSRFRLLVDDSLIIDSHPIKTYPAPGHCHPWALERPGVVLRVCPVESAVPPVPACSSHPELSSPEPTSHCLERTSNG